MLPKKGTWGNIMIFLTFLRVLHVIKSHNEVGRTEGKLPGSLQCSPRSNAWSIPGSGIPGVGVVYRGLTEGRVAQSQCHLVLRLSWHSLTTPLLG